MTTENNLERQIGCMASLFHIFDRPNGLSGKRLCSSKRLPPTPQVAGSVARGSEKSSPEVSRELDKEHTTRSPPSTESAEQSPAGVQRSQGPGQCFTPAAKNPTRQPLNNAPAFEFQERTSSPWKFSKESPRLSLDSRAIVDAKGSLRWTEVRADASLAVRQRETADVAVKQRHSTSVVVRLMGLESLPSADAEMETKAELRRSVSESRARRGQYGRAESINFQQLQEGYLQSNGFGHAQTTQNNKNGSENEIKEYARGLSYGVLDPWEFERRSVQQAQTELVTAPLPRGIVQRRNFFDSSDFFPELKRNVSLGGEAEKRPKMRGTQETSKISESSKQLSEAMQLKGLLHSNKHSSTKSHRNFACEQHSGCSEPPPIILMKPVRSPVQLSRNGLTRNESSPVGHRPRAGASQHASQVSPAVSPRRDRSALERNVQTREMFHVSTARGEKSVTTPSRVRGHVATDGSRTSPVQSPRIGSRRLRPDYSASRSMKQNGENRNKEERMLIPSEDELSTVSDNNFSICFQSETTEIFKSKQKREGMSLLQRCGKLLQSIEEMNATAAESQPSPNSVLDSSFYKEDSSPSPVMKRCIELKEQLTESEDEVLSSELSSVESRSEDCDFTYVSDIIRAFNFRPEGWDFVSLPERQRSLKTKRSRRDRNLIFDIIREILDRKRWLPPWKAVSCSSSSSTEQTSLHEIWSEYQKMTGKGDTSEEDLCEAISSLLRKDFAQDGINGWKDCYVETADTVLDIERLIFKDLIGETIRGLAILPGPRRKLVF